MSAYLTEPFLVLVPVGAAALAVGPASPLSTLTLLGFATAPIAACIVVPELYAIDCEGFALLPFGALLAAAGARAIAAGRSRGRRIVAAAPLVAVPAHFAFFLFDYFRDYPPRSAFWFSWNRRGAIEEVLAEDHAHGAAAVYLSTHSHHVDRCLLAAVSRAELPRRDLLAKTVYFDPDRIDVESIPIDSLLLVGPDDKARPRCQSPRGSCG